MPTIIATWARLPVVVRAVLAGAAVAAAGIVPWAALASANIAYRSSVPWAIGPGALCLWLFWRYVNGAGWPRSTAAARRAHARANAIPDDVWSAALFAGVLGLVALVLGLRVYNRLVTLPPASDELKDVPLVTSAFLLLLAALVAGVVEETAYRGFMQRPIERRHGGAAAILLTGAIFASMHFVRDEVTLALMPFFLAVGVLYGALAHITDSTLPGIVLHAGGNAFGYVDLLATGQAEWQATSRPLPLVWEAGADGPFWATAAAALAASGAAIWAYVALARVARRAQGTIARA